MLWEAQFCRFARVNGRTDFQSELGPGCVIEVGKVFSIGEDRFRIRWVGSVDRYGNDMGARSWMQDSEGGYEGQCGMAAT